MSRDLFERDVLIVEKNNGKEKKIRESYKRSEKGMIFDVKTDIDGQINETSGVLTNQDIEDMFSRIPRYKGFQLPRQMINDFLIGHDTPNMKEGKHAYDMTNNDISNVLNNINAIHLKPISIKKRKSEKKKGKAKGNKKTPPKRVRSAHKKKKGNRKTVRLPKIHS